MNLLYVISSLKHGGAEKQTVIDANTFSANHNIVLVTFQDGELRSLLNEKIKVLQIGKKGYLKTAKVLRETIINEKIDLVNASLFASMIISVLACDKIGIPVFWYFHSHEYDIRLKSRLAFKYFAKKNSLKKIFFVSEELKKHFSEKGFEFPENKTEVLHNNYTVSNNETYRDNGHNTIRIGYIGRLAGLKRVKYLMELAVYLIKEGINDFQIDIVGDGSEKKELEDYSVSLGVCNFINLEGFRKDVENYYNRFDIFAFPSGEECLSISLIDACVKGLPSVAFDVGGNNEILINEKTGYLVDNKDDFFFRVADLVRDEQKRMNFGREARFYCMEKFSVQKRLEKLESCFAKLN